MTVRDDIKIFAPKPTRKRGRRPSFSRTKSSLPTLEMVAFLGNNKIAREKKHLSFCEVVMIRPNFVLVQGAARMPRRVCCVGCI